MELSWEYIKYDTELAARLFECPSHKKSLKIAAKNYWQQASQVDWSGVLDPPVFQTWNQEKQAQAKLESKRELARQALIRNNFGPGLQAMGIYSITNALSLEELASICDSYDIVYKEEGEMATKNEEIALLKAEIGKLTKKLEIVEHGRMGKEPSNGSVFKIEKRYSENGPKYHYAAIRANNMWFLTGTTGAGVKQYNWDQLKDFVGKYSRVWVMTAREELVDY